MVNRKKIFTLLLIFSLGMLAFLFIVIACLPYPALKSLFNSLVSDGNFKSLNENNASIFRIMILSTSFILVGCIITLAGKYLKNLINWIRQYFIDLKAFIKSLKPSSFDLFSLIILCLILGSALIFRLSHIYDQFIHDEGYTYTVFSSTSLFNILTNYHLPNNHVLNSLLIYFSTHILGNQPWVVRLPSLLAGFFLIPCTFILVNKLYDKYTALLSAILITILPGAIRYSTLARGYSLVAFFTILALILACYVKQNKNLFAWSLIVFSCSLGFFSNPVMLFPFGIVFCWLFFENLFSSPGPYGSKLNFIKYWFFAGTSTAILVLILYTPIFIYSGVDKVFKNPWVSPQPWSGYLSSIPNQISSIWQDWTTGVKPIWPIILIIGFFLSLVLHNRISKFRFPLQIASIIWFMGLVFLQRPAPAPKVWVFLQALFVIWSAAGIIGLINLLQVRFSRNVPLTSTVVCGVLLVVLVNAIKIAPTIHQRWSYKGPVENTVISIKSQLSSADLIIIDEPYDAVAWYYADIYSLPTSCFNKSLPFSNLFVIVDTVDGQSLKTVLQSRGPDINQVDVDNSHLLFSYGFLETYIVPHR